MSDTGTMTEHASVNGADETQALADRLLTAAGFTAVQMRTEHTRGMFRAWANTRGVTGTANTPAMGAGSSEHSDDRARVLALASLLRQFGVDVHVGPEPRESAADVKPDLTPPET
jgi:hypothetical protein